MLEDLESEDEIKDTEIGHFLSCVKGFLLSFTM